MNTLPKFTSKCTLKSLWQEYRIYDDRLEFSTMFGKMVIPFGQIEKITLEGSDLKGLLHGNLHLKDFRPALKLDFANFKEHLVLDKTSGKIRRILFTPDDPEIFQKELDLALTEYHNKQ
jgi:hypothetical protein